MVDLPVTVHIGTSIGVVRFPEEGSDYAAVLRSADTALYEAKDAGRGRVVEASHA